MKKRTLQTIWPVLMALIFTSTAAAAVSVDEVIRLHDRGLSTEALLLVVQTSDTPDTISTQQLNDLLDAGVADTVITTLIAQADAVAEDWEPVDVDEAVDNYRVIKKTEYVYVDDDPDWNVSIGFGWGDPYYYSYWYRPLYVGYGWDPFWDPWYWGWCGSSYYTYWGYYDPWYYRPYYYSSIGWYWGDWGWGGHHHHHDYWYGHDDRYRFSRLAERPSYRNSVYRTTVNPDDGKSYRGTTGLTSRTDIRDAGRERTAVDKSSRAGDRTITTKDTRLRVDKNTDRPRVDTEPDVKTPRKATNRYDKKSGDTDVRTEVKSNDNTRRSIFDRSGKTETREAKLERFKSMKDSEHRIFSRDRTTEQQTIEGTRGRRTTAPRRATTGTKERQPSTTIRRTDRAPVQPRTKTESPKVKSRAPEKREGDRSVAPQPKSDRSSSSRSVGRSAPSRAPQSSGAKPSSRGSSGKSSGGGKGRSPR